MEKGKAAYSSAEIQSEKAIVPSPHAEKKDEEHKNDSVIIEIPEFDKFEKWEIVRVPRKLRKLKENAFTPQLVSIGPFHYGKKELEGMESYKKKYLEEFCCKCPKDIKKDDLLSFVSERTDDIRDRYAGTIEIDPKSEEFSEMILRDACFIYELFYRAYERKRHESKFEKDYIIKTAYFKNAIKQDLILLENQLPFSFLKDLFKFAKPSISIESENTFYPPESGSNNCRDHLFKGIGSCLNFSYSSVSTWGCRDLSLPLTENLEETSSPAATNNESDSLKFLQLTNDFFDVFPLKFGENNEIKNFPDLIRQYWFPKDESGKEDDNLSKAKVVNVVYSATKLDKAGLNFVPVAGPLAKVKISTGPWYKYTPWFRSRLKLELSSFKIEDSTELLMRNIIALEQCLYPGETFICNYVALMSSLINSPEDIDFLCEKDIVKNLLGSSKEAADLVNNLCHEIVEEKFIYSAECKQLKHFYENWVNITRGTLKRVYFNDLWTASSTIFGLILVVFSIYATTMSIIHLH